MKLRSCNSGKGGESVLEVIVIGNQRLDTLTGSARRIGAAEHLPPQSLVMALANRQM